MLLYSHINKKTVLIEMKNVETNPLVQDTNILVKVIKESTFFLSKSDQNLRNNFFFKTFSIFKS